MTLVGATLKELNLGEVILGQGTLGEGTLGEMTLGEVIPGEVSLGEMTPRVPQGEVIPGEVAPATIVAAHRGKPALASAVTLRRPSAHTKPPSRSNRTTRQNKPGADQCPRFYLRRTRGQYDKPQDQE